ncbi:uncharacterized protein B0I36DRAFT_431083 [Microdochium trichocladiopsis]|uniref:Uncharacterized protein n=1 Tax=Microdochium trichocladiopsis TaxID=1682393 RepID=A0A9P8Y6X3_9PEZI|nr:uncharacterized protein B0I36DRAFT_431083 [Microdochium trichocladiopsis]KAH7030833.1 hypothetical protein B0I36DRAFT_431083 [Microdochium trichocladiopsis]
MRTYFLSDEELGKKDDDHKHHKHSRHASGGGSWQPARSPRRRLLKRALLAGMLVGFIIFFIHNIPDMGGAHPAMRRPNWRDPKQAAAGKGKPLAGNNPSRPRPPSSQQPHQVQHVGDEQAVPSEGDRSTLAGKDGENSPLTPGPGLEERNYNGPLRFAKLAVSLRGIGATKGNLPDNKNVLFAVSSLKSAATLIPMACEMGLELRSYVHVAIMGRSDIHLTELKKINGADESCSLIYHDARPDYSQISTESRMETATFRAFHHIHTYVHPQAIFIDASSDEDPFFQRGARQQADAVGNTLIEVPPNAARKLSWVSKLNSKALRIWNKVTVDILIQATPGTTGGLVRLLKSLSEADYTAGSLPHITIELPHDVDMPTRRYLESFSWPPRHVHNPFDAHLLTLRHRIPSKRLDEDEAAARFVESFWPSNPGLNDVLLLSPQAEVSGNWYHYVKFTLLANRFQASITSAWDRKLFGISLAQPRQLLDGKTAFSMPKPQTKTIWQDGKDRDVVIESHLWQAPTSDAILIMGDKWVELHDLVSRTLGASTTPASGTKIVSKQYPSWLEHAARLCRARGYWTLYPGDRMARELASLHGELAKAPEEYTGQTGRRVQNQRAQGEKLLSDDASETEVEEARRRLKAEADVGFTHTALLSVLPNQGHVIPLPELPLLAWDGTETTFDGNDEAAAGYAAEFRRQVGGCKREDDVPPAVAEYSTRDLFCEAA